MEIDEDLIRDIQNYLLAKTGILYFNKIKSTPKDIMVSCPFHKEGQERKPSCGIKKYDDEKGGAGQVHCFSCGEQTNLIGMLQKVLGSLYNEMEVESRFHLRQMSYQSILQEKPKPLFKLPSQVEYVPESVLRRFRGIYHPYLERRGISREIAELYDIGYEDENKHITFPIKDQQNRCVGIGRRSVIGKQYYYPQGMVKPLYGLYEITFPIRSLWVVEGPFNMWSLTQWGKKAVAMLGTGTSYQYEQFKDLAVDIYVLALDPDPAGRNGTRKLAEYLFNIGKHRVFVCDLPDGKDINDLSQEEFRGCEVLSYYEWKNKYKIL